MKAIVLTYDPQVGFAELLYKMYMEKWPNCPLTFRIPWNNHKHSYFLSKPNVELIQCGTPIRDTMHALLGDIDSEQFVYWCIDDRFPKIIRRPQELSNLHDYLSVSGKSYDFDAVKVCHWFGRKNSQEKIKNSIKSNYSRHLLGNTYQLHVKNLQWGYYHHQFCKVKYLKKLFLSKSLCLNYHIRGPNGLHNELINGNSLNGLKALSPQADNITFGEPLSKTNITPDGEKYMIDYDCKMPRYSKTLTNKSFS